MFRIYRAVSACSGTQIGFLLERTFEGTFLEAVQLATTLFPHGHKVERV